MQGLRLTQPARKHRTGRARVLHVMNTCERTDMVARAGESSLRWVGSDDRGVILEVVAVIMPDHPLVIHAMLQYRGGDL